MKGPAPCAAGGRLFEVAASAQLLQDCRAVGCALCSCRTLRACSAGRCVCISLSLSAHMVWGASAWRIIWCSSTLEEVLQRQQQQE